VRAFSGFRNSFEGMDVELHGEVEGATEMFSIVLERSNQRLATTFQGICDQIDSEIFHVQDFSRWSVMWLV